MELARLGLRIEEHYGTPQDIEWALDGDARLWIVQSRPITTLGPEASAATTATPAGPPTPRSRTATRAGRSRSWSAWPRRPGLGVGRVRVLTAPEQGRDLVGGEILVAPMTSPDWVPTIRRAAGLVTDSGGMTCHAAIVTRELGIPGVVGARQATTVLRDGELVTVDGATGEVFRGDVSTSRTGVLPTTDATASGPAPSPRLPPSTCSARSST